MTPFQIDVDDAAVRQALSDLAAKAKNPAPALDAIGEALYRMTRRTFETSTDPWGRRWQPNAQSTLLSMLGKRSGSYNKRGGKLSAKGAGAVKKPLIGAGKFLSGPSLSYRLDGNNSVVVGSSAIYAAIHQFGGQAGRGKRVSIPARPFLPITSSGQLAPAARAVILEKIAEFLENDGQAMD